MAGFPPVSENTGSPPPLRSPRLPASKIILASYNSVRKKARMPGPAPECFLLALHCQGQFSKPKVWGGGSRRKLTGLLGKSGFFSFPRTVIPVSKTPQKLASPIRGNRRQALTFLFTSHYSCDNFSLRVPLPLLFYVDAHTRGHPRLRGQPTLGGRAPSARRRGRGPRPARPRALGAGPGEPGPRP